MHKQIAIMASPAVKIEKLAARSTHIADKATLEQATWLSNAGKHFTLTSTDTPPHLYTPLTKDYQTTIIAKELSMLYATEFTAAWIAKILSDMGEGSEIWLETHGESQNKNRNQITYAYLLEYFPNCNISEKDQNWIHIPYSKEIITLGANINSLYNDFHNQFDAFKAAFAKGHKDENWDEDFIHQDAMRMYIYSLFGANHKSFIVKKLVASLMKQQTELNLYDLGGGYGFLAAEMAYDGHHVRVTDYLPAHVEIGHWLMQHCDLTEKSQLSVQKIEDIIDEEGQEQYDIISYFGCLLYAERHKVPDVLQASMRLLKPGGLLLIHENPPGVIKPDARDYPICFKEEELNQLLIKHAGKPRYFNVFNAHELAFSDVKGKVIMAVVQKEQENIQKNWFQKLFGK